VRLQAVILASYEGVGRRDRFVCIRSESSSVEPRLIIVVLFRVSIHCYAAIHISGRGRVTDDGYTVFRNFRKVEVSQENDNR